MNREVELKEIIEKTFDIKVTSINSFGNRIIFVGNDFLLDLNTENNNLNIETISIPYDKRNLGLTKKFVKELINYVQRDKELLMIKITAVISSHLESICKDFNFKHEDYKYPGFNIDEYDSFDGFYGSYYLKIKNP